MSPADAEPAGAEAWAAVTADVLLDAALTLFAERGYHGRHPMYARAWTGPRMSAQGR